MRHRSTTQKGAALIESAIVLLTFLVILFGIMEAGRLMNVQETLTDAAREGARFAVAPMTQTSTHPSVAEIQAVVDVFLHSTGINGATTTVQQAITPFPPLPGGYQTTYTRVRVDYQYQPLIGKMFFPGTLSLKGEALMRNETSP